MNMIATADDARVQDVFHECGNNERNDRENDRLHDPRHKADIENAGNDDERNTDEWIKATGMATAPQKTGLETPNAKNSRPTIKPHAIAIRSEPRTMDVAVLTIFSTISSARSFASGTLRTTSSAISRRLSRDKESKKGEEERPGDRADA